MNRLRKIIPQTKICYCSRDVQTATNFADASHSKSAKSVTITVSYGIFSSENAYPCTVTRFFIFCLQHTANCSIMYIMRL